MKNLNEYSSSYPTSIGNSQSQEYPGVFSPFDAEKVQGQNRLNPLDPEGLHRLNAFLKHFFRRTSLNPQHDLHQLKVRLNHLNYDFDVAPDAAKESDFNVEVSRGQVFGTTPTHDLSTGFYTGNDLPKFNLNFKVNKTSDGYKIDAVMTPKGEVTESMMKKVKRNKRIKTIKEMVSPISEQEEIRQAHIGTDITGAKETETIKSRKREDRQLKRIR
jgi:hypothetical protein